MPHFACFRRMLPRAALLLCLLLLCFLLPLTAGCGSKLQNALKVQDTLTEAYRYAQTDPDDKRARIWTDKAIAFAPNSPDTYFGDPNAVPGPQLSVAALFGDVGDDAALADYMAQAVQKFPNDQRGYQLLADAQGRLGRAEARKATAAALVPVLTKKRQAPGTQNIEELTVALAQAQFDAGNVAAGTAAYQKALQAYPSSPTIPNNFAYAYATANTNLPAALALAQQALALARKKGSTEAEIATYQDTLGWVQYRMGNLQAAQENLLEAAGAVPRLPEVRFHLGTVYAAQGKTDAARAELGHAVLLSPGYAAAHQALDALSPPVKTAAH